MDLVALLVRALYGLFALLPQRDEVAFLSRQSSRPFDFVLLEPSIRERCPDADIVWVCLPESGKFDVRTMVLQLYHAARAKVCLIDGYVPAISIPKKPHRAYCLQVWHAPGAIKKFGYQSVGTSSGRSAHAAEAFSMHRGYDCIVAGFEGAVPAYEEAFGYPAEKIYACGLPRMEYLASPDFARTREHYAGRVRRALIKEGFKEDGRKVVLYAPTFRRAPSNPRWLEDSVEALAEGLPRDVCLVVSGHPIDVERLKIEPHGADDSECAVFNLTGIGTIHALSLADYVVTDYSTVAFEAGVARKKVLFYVPDIEEYRESPGLNVDPCQELPTLTYLDAKALCAAVGDDLRHGSYDAAAFEGFMRSYGLTSDPSQSIREITDLIEPHVNGTSQAQGKNETEMHHG